ncbi:hypothetical protein F6R98_10770 [Candidatus Methylospira mobilis]|uniref:Phage tail protein n=1 Tax=Candidatus Methylospira mobilis TaxID=1808979 RepID=A0A5Q0BGV4_9GAMM|nr:hypothetical protein [Candidatus Methylospira mobilis]QFY43040.1 hypothetical protein F6R98_10770 [Candidatus Methylospira mobilis]
MIVFTITAAGIATENAAMETGTMPVYGNIVIGDGTPADVPFNANDLTHQVLSVPVLVVERLSAGAVRLHANIPPDVELRIREIGLRLSDGTLYAYAPYDEAAGGFYKPSGFDFSFDVVLAREQLANLTFTYTPVDVQSIADSITNTARNAIDAYMQTYIIDLTAMCSRMSRNLIELQQRSTNVKLG